MESKGLVFDIRRFSTHDGPGIRTTVFTKGCPLRCRWCQNPEGLEPVRRLCSFENKCIGCGECIKACPRKAISFKAEMPETGRRVQIDRKLCDLCGLCVEACPAMALAFDSREMSVSEVVEELLKDKEFYSDSGGITLSGGDPFSQKEFNLELLKECKSHGLRTAIETCLYVDGGTLLRFLPYLDLLIADFKLYDPKLHRLYTGQDNGSIKENLAYLIKNFYEKNKLDMLVRLPLIPEHTATRENLEQSARFLYSLSPEVKVELINYNPLAQNKYILMNKRFVFDKNPGMYKKEELEAFCSILAEAGLTRIIKE